MVLRSNSMREMIMMNTQTKTIATHLITGVEAEWQDYLYELLEQARDKDIPVDFNHAEAPLPKQLRNSCVIREYKDGSCEYNSSQIWLAIDQYGNRTIIEPKETSGVLIEGETGKILKTFNCLPEPTPKGTQHLIRILIRKETDTKGQQNTTMHWKLYTDVVS